MHDKQADPFYSSGPWRRVRTAALARDLGLCQDCLALYMANPDYQVKTAEMVHHIKPRKTNPELELSLDNLISLCDQHHEQRHPERRKSNHIPEPPAGIRVIKI